MGVRDWWAGVRDRLESGADDGADEEELPLAQSADELIDRLREVGLGPHASRLAALGRRGVRLVPVAEAGRAAGASRLGGVPDLPIGETWPRHEGVPLSFLGQLDLTGLRAALGEDADVVAELPASGMLSFFVLIDDSTAHGLLHERSGSFRLLLHDGPTEPASPPGDLDPEAHLGTVAIGVAVDWTPAPDESVAVNDVLAKAKHPDRYLDAVGGGEDLEMGPHRHRLLGNPDQVQGDLGWEAGDATGTDAEGWRLLLQVDSDEDDLEVTWGDAGRLYWLIREDDLRAQRWERVHLVGQCY